MKTKRILALAIAVLMIVSCFASCRTKDENAFTFTYGDKTVNIRTALYMCFLMDADMNFQNKAITAAEDAGTEYEDYKDLKYEDKDYYTWTKDEAKSAAEKYAYTEIQFERLGYSFSEDEEAYIDTYYVDAYWDGSEESAGISELYEANGVSYDTFRMYYYNTIKQDMVYSFYVEDATEEDEHDHDHEDETTAATTAEGATAAETTTEKKIDPELEKLRGSLRPTDKEINSALSKNFVPVDIIDVSLLDDEGNEKDDTTKDTQLKMLKDFAKELNNGKDFATIYSSYQVAFGITTDTTTTDSATDYEQVLLSAEANEISGNESVADENFAEAYKLEVGKATVVKNDDCYALIMRKDILKGTDSTGTSFKDSYTDSAILTLVQDAYDSDIVDAFIKEMECKANDSAIKYYNPDKIDYLNETTTTGATDYVEY